MNIPTLQGREKGYSVDQSINQSNFQKTLRSGIIYRGVDTESYFFFVLRILQKKQITTANIPVGIIAVSINQTPKEQCV